MENVTVKKWKITVFVDTDTKKVQYCTTKNDDEVVSMKKTISYVSFWGKQYRIEEVNEREDVR